MLQGIKIVEFQGLAPTVFCGMYFADQGAEVVMITRPTPAPFSIPIHLNLMNRGKKCITLNPKLNEDFQMIVSMIKEADIVIDPYRPGVLEKLKLGPQDLKKINPKIVLLRVSGYGQKGKMALRPGHDLNYLALSGIIPLINEGSKQLQFPTNYLADFVASSLGIVSALAGVQLSIQTGQGGEVDCSLSDSCKYLANLITIKQKSCNNDFNTYFPTVNGKMYCVTTKLGQQQIEKHLIQAASQMQQKNIHYLSKNYFQISLVRDIPDFEEQLSGGLKNPFSKENGENLQKYLPNRNQNSVQLRNRYTKPKL